MLLINELENILNRFIKMIDNNDWFYFNKIKRFNK